MKIFRKYSQNQRFLLPPSLDEFVPENHEARIINDVVDTMDLSPLLAKYAGGGAPAYHPAMMLNVFRQPGNIDYRQEGPAVVYLVLRL